MKIKIVLLTLTMLASLILPAFARPFPKSQQYMSGVGFARWQYYMATHRWLPR